ncbi:MAG: bifunctional DNA-formamidopyrimidine glycosylase/DNA-(apurinic or apyrimidinic site) lyase [Actinomycetota bacterium]|nr:bifunctional DNA-formamidopyrimidine glycosylase/DNA-(apurinic or apyrimidinic site) lyase [Actinomycetota bacterium]
MPELPEVEVVRRGLEGLAGQTVSTVEVLTARSVRRHLAGPADFAARLAGRRLGGARRRGKYLWLPLDDDGIDDGEVLLGHLGMSGQFLVVGSQSPVESHLRVRLGLEPTRTGPELDLRFVDQRTFGGLLITTVAPSAHDGTVVPAPITHLGVDPLEPTFDSERCSDRLRHRRTGVKRALLDQTLVSGVGNIYADEALWRARLHYARPTETLRRAEVERLLAAVRSVLQEALGQGGTSFDALYVDVDGQAGYFDRALAVYGREDQPCPRCGTPIRRHPFMNRSSYVCPRCQPRPRRARW